MKTQRKPMTRLEVLVLIAIIALTLVVIVGVLDLYSRYSGHAATALQSRTSSRSSTGAGEMLVGFRPRNAMVDTSGFGPIATAIERWDPNASLQTIAETWKQVGYKAISKLEAPLQAARNAGDSMNTFNLLVLRAMFFDSEGEPKRAYEDLVEARALLDKNEVLARHFLYTVVYFQGVVAMRRGENENCIECRGESSCIIPISPAAVHTIPTGSRGAIEHFTEYLRQFPDDLEVRWLLNLAHMTLGEHPGKVDPKYLIPLDRFTQSEFDIGRFRDVGHLLGVNRFNQAGGSIMDDFDNDGLLDIALTSLDPTQSMAYYRNKGDGTFEDRSLESGVTDQLGGLVCYQTDYNNDGRLDVFIPRGAWLPYAIRPSLLRNDGGGKFTDVTKEAGMLEPVNSNAACWADYDNDGWLDVFIGCERQPNLLYHNRGNGTFEEVSARAGLRENSQLQFCKGTTWLDLDNDGYPDLFLNNLGGAAKLFRNNRNGTFTDVTSEMGIDGPQHGFSCWTWDYDNDGWLDIFATCYDRSVQDVVKGLLGMPHSLHSNRLFRNLGGKGFDDKTKEAGLDMVFATMGSNYADLDNDGFLDMYLGTGDPSFATLVPNRMFKNVGGSRFSEITGTSGTGHLQKGHGVACGDWDRDGDVDVFIETGGAVNGDKFHDVLFQNPGQGNHWLTVKLIGKKTNRAAIGARIKVVTSGENPLTVHRHVSSGSSFGANPLQQTIGLAHSKKVAVLEVHWPTSGTTQVFRDIPVDQAIEVTEFAESYRPLDWRPIPLPK
jgi:FG-GAP-like repeat/ASPIC and UnbV